MIESKQKSMASRENLNPQALSKIAKELAKLSSEPVSNGIKLIINERDITDVQADIEGPTATPYEGGVFRCKLIIGSEFPAAPPRGVFLTKIFHPNVSTNGDICVNTLKKDWNPDYGIMHILQVIRCLLIVPFPESALNEEASRLFLESYDEYARRAALMTSIHAKPASKTKDTPSGSTSACNGSTNDVEATGGENTTNKAGGATNVAPKKMLVKKQSSSARSALKRL